MQHAELVAACHNALVLCSCARSMTQQSSAGMSMQTQNGNGKLWKLSCSLPVSISCTPPHILHCGNHIKTSWMTLEHLHRLLAEYIQELNMHQGLYSAVVRSLQHYDRLQSHAGATTSSATPANFANKEVCSSITLCWSCMACLLKVGFGSH